VTRERADARRNRDRLLAAGRDVFRRGGETVQLADVARAAGVSLSSVHRHFPTRDALLETLAREHFAGLLAVAERALADPDPFAGVAGLLRGLLDAQLAQRGMSSVLTAAVDAQPETTRAKARLDQVIGAVLARARHDRTVRPEVTPADLRQLVGGIELAHDRRDPAGLERAYLHLAVVTDGLRRRSTGGDDREGHGRSPRGPSSVPAG
jgi:AcrR family transcriptional regulator